MTQHQSRGHSRAGLRLVRAAESMWPVLAGALLVVGLVGAALQYGLAGTVVLYLASAVLTMVMVYAVYADSGVTGIPVLRIGLVAALVLVVLLGVLALFPVAGGLLAAVAAATSPPVTSRLGGPRRASRGSTSATTRWIPQDQTLVDQAFQRIVAGLEKDPSWGPDAT
jgi:hypothetical protein